MTTRVSTGIEILDRKLDGGVPPGSIVALSAEPASQSELFLYEFTRARRTLYVTTRRTALDVREALAESGGDAADTAVRELSASAPLTHAGRLTGAVPEGVNVVVDPMDPLEREERGRLRDFLNALRSHLRSTGSIAVLHCLDGRNTPDNRDTTEYMADVVFRLSTGAPRDTVENRLTVPKFRGGDPPREVIKLELSEAVAIDISRDIG